MLSRRAFSCGALAAISTAALPSTCDARTFPSRMVRIYNGFAAGGPTVPLTRGVVGGGDGRGQAGTSTANSIIPVIGGQQTIVSCNSQSVTLQIEDIKVTLTGLCGYRVILDTVSKENLPGDLGQGNNLEEGVTIKILKSEKMIDTLPVDASLEVVYPKPASGSTTILTWNGNAWVEQTSFVEGKNITTKITSPTTLILVTH